MLLELGDMFILPSLIWITKWNGRRVVTLIAIPSIHHWLFSGQRVPHWKRWEYQFEIWYTGLGVAATEFSFTSTSLHVSSSEEEDPE